MRTRRRQVDDAAADEGPAIVDAHHDRTAGVVIGDPHHGAERQGAMGGGERPRRKPFAARGPRPLRIDGSNTRLRRSAQSKADGRCKKSESKYEFPRAKPSHYVPITLLIGRVVRLGPASHGAYDQPNVVRIRHLTAIKTLGRTMKSMRPAGDCGTIVLNAWYQVIFWDTTPPKARRIGKSPAFCATQHTRPMQLRDELFSTLAVVRGALAHDPEEACPWT